MLNFLKSSMKKEGGSVGASSNPTAKPVVKNLAEGEVVPTDEKPKSELIKGVLKKNGYA